MKPRHFCLLLSVVGIVLSALLLVAHVQMGEKASGGKGHAFLPMVLCGESGRCDQVLGSRWAWFPPLPADHGTVEQGAAVTSEPASSESESEAGKGIHFPVALCGLFYFSALALWFAAFGRESRKGPQTAVLSVCIAGAAGSAGFLVLMGTVIGTFCPLCTASHIANFLLLGCAWRWWRGGRSEAETGASRPDDAGAVLSLRSGALAGAFLLALWTAEGLASRSATLARENGALSEALDAIQQDVDAMELVYLGQPKQNVIVRDDQRSGLDVLEFDAAIAAADGYRNTVVIFSDVECRSCRRFHEFLFDTVMPFYEGHLRVVYKHLPYDAGHPNARRAALALEAARRQDKFWELLDLLYAEQGALAGFDYSVAIARLDLDGTRFVRDMTSPEVAERIAEDEKLARDLGVNATPAVFLNSRRVEKSLLRLPGFWNSQVARLKRTRADAGQGWGNSPPIEETMASATGAEAESAP